MKTFWQLLYNYIFLPLFYLSIKFISIFNRKVRQGINGRKRIFEDLIIAKSALDRRKKIIWFHSSSLGEFEQAKPIIEELKNIGRFNIIVSFFSPSGYLNSKKYSNADLITYLPFDTKQNAKRFLEIVQPDLALFMRYDIWPNHIWALAKSKIPCMLVDATMRSNSPRKWIFSKSFHKILFGDIVNILTVSEKDADGFIAFGIDKNRVTPVGDTRFDRVLKRSNLAKESKLIDKKILDNRKIFVAGSTWEQDEEIILPAFTKLAKNDEKVILIIAPHEPNILHLEKLENEFAGVLSTIRFSHLNSYKDERVIIVDSIGILLTLYTYADAAFVGGSFKQNVHNVLEAAVYGIPVLFGPKIENSQEAKNLSDVGGGIILRNKKEAYRRLRSLFSDESLRKNRGKISYEYVQRNAGATDKIIKEIFSTLKL